MPFKQKLSRALSNRVDRVIPSYVQIEVPDHDDLIRKCLEINQKLDRKQSRALKLHQKDGQVDEVEYESLGTVFVIKFVIFILFALKFAEKVHQC